MKKDGNSKNALSEEDRSVDDLSEDDLSEEDISEEDKALFRQAVGGATPKTPKARKVSKTRRPSPPTASKIPPAVSSNQITASISRSRAMLDETHDNSVLFVRSGLQKKVIKHLRRGDYGIKDILDLHGYTIAQAKTQLSNFLTRATHARYPAVLIIHGKGLHGDTPGGTLKRFTIDWLKQQAAVKAFCAAQPKDGGTGAVYVLLRSGKARIM